jgi:GAF domain-containing protein
MHDHQLYLKTLSEFTRLLLAPCEVHTALHELAGRVTDVLGLAGSGVSLAHGDRLEFDAANGPTIAEVERTQERVQLGPCVTAFRTCEVVAVTDLPTFHDWWPDYCDAAARAGITAVASLPMQLGEGCEQPVGVLDLYGNDQQAWTEEDLAAAEVMAEMATAHLINVSDRRRQVELAEQLQRALDSRVVIEQAKGVLVGKHQLTPDEAFDRIRRHARSHNANLTDIAEAVVGRGLDP